MSADQIAKRLDDRFRLLTGGGRAVLERHQTLRAAIDWSYNLLSENEKRLFYRLSVFSGGWTLDAAEQVCGIESEEFDVLDLVSRLVDKSLIILVGAGNDARYHMLETTRQYAREKLFESGGSEILHNQHLAYFLELAEKGNDDITGPSQAEAIDLLDAERDNFRAALDWSVSCQNAKAAAQLLGALGWAWDVRGYYDEAFAWFEKIRLLPDVDNFLDAYGRLLNHIGRFAVTFEQRLDANATLEKSRGLWTRLGSQGEKGLADVLCFLGMQAAGNERDINKAESLFRQSVELAQKSGNQRILSASTLFIGEVESERGNTSSTLRLYEQSMELAQRAGDLFMIGIAAGDLADLFVDQGNYDKARSFYVQQLSFGEKIQFRLGVANTLAGLGNLYRYLGNFAEAEIFFDKSLPTAYDIGLRNGPSFILYSLGMLALQQKDYSLASKRFKGYFDFGQPSYKNLFHCRFLRGMSAVAGGTNQSERCAKLLGASQALFDKLEYPIPQFDLTEFDRHVQIARDQLGKGAFDMLCNEGHTMTVEQAITLALEENHE